MKKLIIVSVCAVAALPASPSTAHDFTATYASLAECQRAYVQMNKADRSFLPTMFADLFTSKGAAQRYVEQYISCEYDASRHVWYMADHRPN